MTTKMCENYLISVHERAIVGILEDPDKDKNFSVNINFLELFESDTNLGNALLTDPENTLKNWNESVFNVQNNLVKEIDKKYTLKNNVKCRIYNLPPWPHVCRTIFPSNDDANKFLQVTGTVVRMSARKLLEYQRQYICTKCKYPITVEAKYDKRNIIKQPKKCTNPEGCIGKNIITFGELDPYNCKDYQEIKIQEDLSKMGVGTVPGHMVVTLEDDLVNVCKPGENITVTGVVKRRFSEFEKGVKITVEIVIKANHIQVNNSSGLSISVSDDMRQFFASFWTKYRQDPLVGRNIILKSISPEIYGRQLVKLAIAIVLAGGSPSEENQISTGIETRSESHLLLVGDPGTGKSQMLRYASKIVPRSVLTTGVGSTAAGLTVTAIMENGEWQLEAGALVMADGGICCIDEFNSMREHDRTSIHEAMEQQTISVAKAGIVCKLKTRCSILAACNPKGNIDPSQPLCVNVAMSSPLLSRFDLVLLLRDIVSEENDRKLAEYLLSNSSELSGDGIFWSLEKLQAYYAVIKKKCPKLTAEAEMILSTYYQLQRKFGSRNKSRTTLRLLESLIRLSQGHAKLIYHDEVEVIDTIFAIILVDAALDYESSLFNLNVDNDSFFENPEQLYWDLLENILGKLNLDYIYRLEIEKRGVQIEKSSQNTNVDYSEKEDNTSPNLGDHRIVSQNVVTSTPKRSHLLFSQMNSRQKQQEQSDLTNSQSGSREASQNSESFGVSNRSQFLSQKSPERDQNKIERILNLCNNDIGQSSQSSSEITENGGNTGSAQRGSTLLFTQRRFGQKVQEKSSTENGGNTGSAQKELKLLFTQRRFGQKVQEKSPTENGGNTGNAQNGLKLLFTRRRFGKKVQEKSPKNFSEEGSSVSQIIEENQSTSSNLLFAKNIVSSTVHQNISNDSGNINHSSQEFTNFLSQGQPNPTQEKNGYQKFSIYQNKNDSFVRNKVLVNLDNFGKRHEESGFGSQNRSTENGDVDSFFEESNTNGTKKSRKRICGSPIKATNTNATEKDSLIDTTEWQCPSKGEKKSKKLSNQNKDMNEIDLLKLMPSVNDDFMKYDSRIDWNMQENNE